MNMRYIDREGLLLAARNVPDGDEEIDTVMNAYLRGTSIHAGTSDRCFRVIRIHQCYNETYGDAAMEISVAETFPPRNEKQGLSTNL